MDSEDCGKELLERVMRQRAEDALKEVRKHYPTATINSELIQGRGIITLYQDRFILSKEFVETAETLRSPHRMTEYRRILLGKARLVLVVPKHQAANGSRPSVGAQQLVVVLLSDLPIRRKR